MISYNNDARAFHNIDAWHRAGYTGKGIAVGSGETFHEEGSHGWMVKTVINEVAPDAAVHYIPIHDEAMQYSMFSDKRLDEMDELGVSVWTVSVTGFTPSQKTFPPKFLDSLNRRIHFAAIGNDGIRDPGGMPNSPHFYGVGAIRISNWNGQPEREPFSSYSDHLDFMAWDEWSMWETNLDSEGTSFASPCVAGMCALINQFFLEKAGHVLSSEEMYKFLKDHTVDMMTEGWDRPSGWGYIVLPDPQDIDIEKYTIITKEDIDMFEDTVGHWAEKHIENCAELGLVKGMDDGLFHPDEKITRAEAATMFDRLVQLVKSGKI